MTQGKRRFGRPRTESERRARHKRLHPGTPLPPRGNGINKVFVKRYWVGFRGTREFDQLVPANSGKEAIKKYARARNRTTRNIILKRR